jgi:hypothetical protein
MQVSVGVCIFRQVHVIRNAIRIRAKSDPMSFSNARLAVLQMLLWLTDKLEIVREIFFFRDLPVDVEANSATYLL